RGRIADEAAARRVDPRQAARARAEAAGQRIVAAGIEEHQVDRVAGELHLAENAGGADRLQLDVAFSLDLGADRQQKILTVDLHAVAGVVEQADAVWSGRAQLLA